MKTKKIDLKHLMCIISVLISMLVWSGNAWADPEYYSKLTASTTESASGKVYVALSTVENDNWVETAIDPSTHNESATSDNVSGKTSQFTAYASAFRGYMFDTWTNPEGDGNPALVDGYTKASNPIQIQVTAPTESGTNEATIQATFVANPVAPWDVKFLPSTNGTYTVVGPSGYDTPIALSTETTHSTYNNDDIVLSATPATGYVLYRYVGRDSDGNVYTIGTLGKATQTVNIPVGTVSVCAEFTSDNFLAAGNTFVSFADAIQATRKSDGTYSGTILLLRDYEVQEGYYTIPKGVTLLIPVDANQVIPRPIIERVNENNTKPNKAYKTLTLATGAHLDVFGAIEVGGRQNCYNNNGQGRPQGATYGVLDMKSGSTITLENGANLYAWGFVIGDRDAEDNYLCSIDVRRGASVHEQFQMYDWEGGSEASNMAGNDKGVFVINEYFIQNVEVATTYRPGSALYTYTGILGEGVDGIKVIGVVGDEAAMFLMDEADDSEDTWVRKSYQPTTDLQVYEINNAAKLGNLEITFTYIFTIVVNSKDYVLPITHNMKIHLLTGQMDITQNTVLLPGAEIEVDKQSTVVINDSMSLYLFDYHEWDAHIHQGKYAWRAEVRPGGISKVRNIDSAEGLGNAKLNIHGTFVADGLLITTEGGAEISSNNNDAGTIIFKNNVSDTISLDKELYVHNFKTKDTQRYYTRPTVPAKLLNGDNSFATTAGTPAGQSYCYMNGKWTMLTVDPDSSCFVYDNYGTYYAKPGEYVAINATKDPSTKVISGNDDHTFSDAEGTGRLFILVDGCQWWEVVNEDNLYHCTHEQNNTYYWWNDARVVDDKLNPGWEEKKFAISWKDYDGSPILDAQGNPAVYYLPYGATPKYLSTNPTRPADVDYTYNFIGWSPAFAPVTGDQAYTATYSKEQIKYTIIFKFVDSYRNGAEIERQQLARDEMPVIPTVKRDGWYLKWTPAIAAVTGNAVYEADWMEELPDTYTITWKNYDGSTLKTTTPARDASAVTVKSEAPSAPEKPATAEYRYEFTGWQPAVTGATADASYVAQYREVAQTYDIRFYKEDGITQIVETQSLPLGADPVVPDYNKNAELQYSYKTQWRNKATGEIVGVSVPSVSGAADYVADFIVTINKYTIQANCQDENENPVNGCTFTGAGTYNYGTDITLMAIPNEGYEFVEWEDNHSTNAERTVTVKASATYTAIVRGAPVMKVRNDETKVIASETKVSALVISATPTSSTDLVGADKLVGTNEEATNNIPVSFDLTRGAGKVFKHHTWYAFSVPFTVDPATILFDGVTMQYHTESKKDDYEILYYNGNERALHGKTANCWVKAETADENLVPGRFYMIAITKRDVTTIRFPKVAGTALLTNSVNVSDYTSANSTDANWNGIANPALYHANMDAIGSSEHYAFTYNPDFEDPTNAYQRITLNTENIKLGTPFFVQAPATKSVVVEPVSGSSAAPRRTKANTGNENGRFKVTIAPAGEKATDNVIVRADEDKEEDTYIIGKDLVRMGMSKIRPQLWVNRYDEKLCVNVIAPTNGQAEYPLGIFAPADGEYTIRVAERSNEETTLYLTYDGRAIWNLSYGEYVASLEQGNDSHYGLRLVQKAPQVATGIDEAVVDAHGDTRKVLINDKVYIVRGEKVYSIDGQLVK